jgi:membrane protease YdiL (CAAX protease family)
MPENTPSSPVAVSLTKPPPLGLAETALLYGAAAGLLFAATHGVIPALAARTDIEPVLLWFAAGGLGVFAPLLLAAIVLLWREGVLGTSGVWRERLWFRPMSGGDWVWSLGGLAAIGLLAAGSMTMMRLLWGEVQLHPSFLSMDPLTPDRYWILAVWLPFWLLNIMGEEILWRGVILPRQEWVFGRWAWLVNGTGWLLFHLPFGPVILLTVVPTTFILPYVVQRRRNSWTAVVIHAGLNGPGFLAVAFGLV